MPERRETDRTTSTVVGRNVARFRKLSGVSTRFLAERMTELGVPLSPSGISDIEAGRRTVSVDQMTALATALGGLSPTALLMPEVEIDRITRLTGTEETTGKALALWIQGEAPIYPEVWDDVFEVEAFRRRNLPAWMWKRGLT